MSESAALSPLDRDVAQLFALVSQALARSTDAGRFYERLGDHAVNLAKRIERQPGPAAGDG